MVYKVLNTHYFKAKLLGLLKLKPKVRVRGEGPDGIGVVWTI